MASAITIASASNSCVNERMGIPPISLLRLGGRRLNAYSIILRPVIT